MNEAPADWQLPLGVDRGLWDYLHDAELPRAYDTSLTDSALLRVDLAFAERVFTRPGRLIDLGCGTGRLLLPFARRGWWVVGVDLSETMLRVTGEKAAAAGLRVERVLANLAELNGLAAGSFDQAACLFSTLGMICGPEARQRTLGHVFRVLRPGGTFLLHVHNRWFKVWDAPGRRWLLGDLLRRLTRRSAAGDQVMPVHQGIANLTLHLFSRREIVRELRATGFRVRTVEPVSLRDDGRLPHAWWFGPLRAYGYLVVAER